MPAPIQNADNELDLIDRLTQALKRANDIIRNAVKPDSPDAKLLADATESLKDSETVLQDAMDYLHYARISGHAHGRMLDETILKRALEIASQMDVYGQPQKSADSDEYGIDTAVGGLQVALYNRGLYWDGMDESGMKDMAHRASIGVGNTVYWRDPGEGVSSGLYTVERIQSDSGLVEFDDTVIVLKNEAGSIAEVTANEVVTDRAQYAEWLQKPFVVIASHSDSEEGYALDCPAENAEQAIALTRAAHPEFDQFEVAVSLTAAKQGLAQRSPSQRDAYIESICDSFGLSRGAWDGLPSDQHVRYAVEFEEQSFPVLAQHHDDQAKPTAGQRMS